MGFGIKVTEGPYAGQWCAKRGFTKLPENASYFQRGSEAAPMLQRRQLAYPDTKFVVADLRTGEVFDHMKFKRK